MSTWFWQQTNDHPALGHVILSTSASQLASTLQLHNASPKTISNATEDAFFFRSQTIKLLQRTLMNTPQTSLESTILIVAHLVCVEVLLSGLSFSFIQVVLNMSNRGIIRQLRLISWRSMHICVASRNWWIWLADWRCWETRLSRQYTGRFCAEFRSPFTCLRLSLRLAAK